MKKKFKLFKFVSLLFFVVFCVVLFNFRKVNAAGGSQGETWIINEEPSLDGLFFTFNVNFTSNNTEYVRLRADSEFYEDSYEEYDIYSLEYYESVNPNESTEVYSYTYNYLGPSIGGWEDEAYRTITFDTAPTGDLLTWLQANAVKVVEVVEVISIEIETPGGKLLLGQTYQINPIVEPEDAIDEVTYHSSNTAVAIVSDSGLVTAVAVGTATITASAGDKSATVVFTVVEDTYSAGYNDGYNDGYFVGYSEGHSDGYNSGHSDGYSEGYNSGKVAGYFEGSDWVLTQVYEYGISTVPKSDYTYYDNTESFDYLSGYGQAWGLGYDLGYSEGSGRPLTPEEEDIVYNWGYNAGYQAGQEDHSVGSLLKQAFGGVGKLLDYELLPNLTIGGIVIVPLLLGIVFFILRRG